MSAVPMVREQTGGQAALALATSPHLHGWWTTPRLMWAVVLALLPCLAAGLAFFGLQAAAVPAAAIAGAAAAEAAINRWRKLPFTLGDGSAVLTGLLLGLILPPAFPLWMACLGGIVSIGLGKAVFGGLGMNVFNPALVGRAFLQAAFPVSMTTWAANRLAVDTVSSATPLALVKFREPGLRAMEVAPPLEHLLLGITPGSLGETSALAILAGGFVLLALKVANWRAPAAMAVGAVALGGALWAHDPGQYPHPLFHLLSGGFLFGAMFMATDLVTSPITARGLWIFGVGAGFLTVLIRLFGGLPEGVMYSILMMNAAVPLINRWTRPRVFGATR
ncbi:MAG TPA: RnfABCDGE type electron transport complex subunit D [Vicinamibacterales bacterium]|nr:RnfABCDGE type electron transport complex subunit D [Vicinamibacterales bacterium]